jgi:spore germination protein GerM
MKIYDAPSRTDGMLLSLTVLLLAVSSVGMWWTARTQPSTLLSERSTPAHLDKSGSERSGAARTGSSTAIASVPLTGTASLSDKLPTASTPQTTLPTPTNVYWLQARGKDIHLVPIPLMRGSHQPEESALTQAITYLFANPTQFGLSSTIPVETKLLSLRVKSTGIYIDLSREFQRGGGSESMIYRVAQVLYTATSLDPDAKVYLSIEGQQIDDNHPLGGEGLMLTEPLTRQQLAKEFSIG